MKKTIVLIYDDRQKPNAEVAEINGGKRFGDTIFKRRTLFEITSAIFREAAKEMETEGIFRLDDSAPSCTKEGLLKRFSEIEGPAVFCHLYSDQMIRDPELFQVLLTKASYAKQRYMTGTPVGMVLCPDQEDYRSFLEEDARPGGIPEDACIADDPFEDLSDRSSFLDYITGGFDARFFNSLQANNDTVTKQSSKIEKIKREYHFYYLLSDAMKHWFVQPFDYREEGNLASYTMERYHMTDVAIRYVHGAVDEKELNDILTTLFRFLGSREVVVVSDEEYCRICDSLYLDKVDERIATLRQMDGFARIDTLIGAGTDYQSLDEIIAKYKKLYNDIIKGRKLFAGKQSVLAAGHGDLCFSNILYQKDARLLRLIDPKGAMTREELFTDPCYDVAKLSHSVCGDYDFFNSGLYEISMDENMRLKLTVDHDPTEAAQLFEMNLWGSGYDFTRVRLCEASLFLSMLPLHMDNPKKVLGFILNAVRILEEIEKGELK